MSDIRSPYMGHFELDGTLYPCSSLAAKIESNPIFYDGIIGIRDSCSPSATKGDGGDSDWGTSQHQKRTWRMSPWNMSANFSGPVFVDGGRMAAFIKLVNYAAHCKTISDAAATFWKNGHGYSITDAFISNLTLNCTAGGTADYSVQMVAKDMEYVTNGGHETPDCLKLVTWDVCGITSSVIPEDFIQSVSLTISQPITPVYTADNGNPDFPLKPTDLRAGIQVVSGTVAVYGFDDYYDLEQDTITVSINNVDLSFNVTYSPPEVQGTAGTAPVVFNVPFYGAGGSTNTGYPVWVSVP